jgi:hypothetical protein
MLIVASIPALLRNAARLLAAAIGMRRLKGVIHALRE